MPGIFPHPSASAESYKIGDQVRWFVSERSISPYVGIVTQICPSINKVWVDFPIGGNQQKDPTELILITPFVGESPVTEDTGYSDYGKVLSDQNYGTLREESSKKLANRMVAKELGKKLEGNRIAKMASKVAGSFAHDVVEKLASDVAECVQKGMTDIQAYQSVYPQYEKICSDGFLRSAIKKIYKYAFSFKTVPVGKFKSNMEIN